MTNQAARGGEAGRMGQQPLALPPSRVDQRQTITEVVVVLLALLLVVALALRLFAVGSPPTMDASFLPVGAALLPPGP